MNKDIKVALIWAAIMIPVALAAKFAHAHGYISSDAVLRVVAMNGLYVAYLGNALPKAAVPHALAQKVRRFGGWSLFLSGLVFTGLWLFAPIPAATVFGSGAILSGVVLTLGYCVWLSNRTRARA